MLPPFQLPTAESSTASSSRTTKPKKPKNNVSQSSIFDLKGLVSEHQSTFNKEGRDAVKGEAGARRGRIGELSKDRFSRPSPNLARRLARQAEVDTRRARIFDDQDRITEHERQEIMRLKTERYEKLRKGEEMPGKESVIDFDRKQEEEEGYDHWSDHESDVDESALVPDNLKHALPPREDDNEEVEYIDELGRTRRGTRREAREAEEAKSGFRGGPREREGKGQEEETGAMGIGQAHAEVLQSNVIYGEQSFFPVYEPTQEELKARYKAAEGGPMVDHYDAQKEVRAKGAGFYQFAQDEEVRKRQMDDLKQQREETERARTGSGVGREESGEGRGGKEGPMLSVTQQANKRKLNERRALIEAKRQKMLGSKEAVDQRKKRAQDRAVDALLRDAEREMEGEMKAEM